MAGIGDTSIITNVQEELRIAERTRRAAVLQE